ncbi:purine-nucleoside phosphorylase [Helicobacter anatolicus]|uniref:phosphorylase family protein n=1 Tax=Helicobacter anatolicus TaxID=2905874 RepID=UPI001E39CD76|nr:purine-nucleoside phosphorylase [Helicobacter anatolicus]MCE3040104.1 purine-nucleoside phosphorylase [Helicobacter anatolicus]
MFVCAGNGENFDFAISVGVGLIESAINLTQICIKNKPNFLCFVGSAGSYDLNLPLLEICTSQESTQIEASFFEDKSYTPIQLHQKSINDVSCETINKIKTLGLRSVIVNSSNYITTDMQIAKKFLKQGVLLENMEFYSVSSVAKKFQIPCMGIFCVSNYCNAQAHQDFIKNHHIIIKKIEEVIKKVVSK